MDIVGNFQAGEPISEEAMLYLHTEALLSACFRVIGRETHLPVFLTDSDLWDFQTLAVIFNECTPQRTVSESTRLNAVKGYYTFAYVRKSIGRVRFSIKVFLSKCRIQIKAEKTWITSGEWEVKRQRLKTTEGSQRMEAQEVSD
jgi:hypothetical protein